MSRRLLRPLLALWLTAAMALGMFSLAAPETARAEVPVYTTPGEHTVNGRQWRTWCQQYSSAVHRCHTEIWATQIHQRPGGGYETVNGWAFNNLTYLTAPESAWAGNPLATIGEFTSEGRRWKTSCRDEWTGPNGCRSFVWSTLVSAQSGRFVQRNQWVFNNIVNFGTMTTPPDVTTPRACTVQVEGMRINLEASHTTATAVRSSGTTAVVTMVERVPGTSCSVRTVFRDTSGRVGRAGVVPAAERRQDTGTTPGGVFTVTEAFGLDVNPGTRLAWRDVGPQSYWVLDRDSTHYNQWREGNQGGFRKDISEHLVTYRGQYDLVGVINYNRSPAVRGKGGAIFIHVHGPGATAGCVSVTKANMLAFLDRTVPGDTITIH